MAATTAPLPMTAGRRAALVIGVPVCLLLVAAISASVVADLGVGSFPVSYRAPAATSALTVNVTGQLTIKPTAAHQATLVGTARYSIVRSSFTEHFSGGTATLGYGCPFPAGECELDATLAVPATVTALTANSGAGDATVTGTKGPVNVSTGSGDLSVTHTAGPLTLNTNSGSIQMSAIKSTALSASSGAGNIQADGITAKTIFANTDSGSIDESGITTTAINASTGNGSVRIVLAGVPDNVRLNSNSGAITLVLPAGPTEYHVMANTDSGTVSDGGIPQNTSSSHVITASSGSGDITITEQ
jgi:hypothetical protein